MFNGFRTCSPSPCSSPVRNLVANLRKGSSPKREKHTTMIESRMPIISSARMTMSGGFQDFRPCSYSLEKGDSLDSGDRTPSVSSSSRSTSCDSNDPPTLDPVVAKVPRRFVKVPRNALKNVIHQLSPRLSKKVMQEEKKCDSCVSQHPMWPNVMTTYARGVSATTIQSLVTPTEPSLTAMKAKSFLDDRKNFRLALQMLLDDINLKHQSSHSDDSSSYDSSDQEDSEDHPDNSIPRSCIGDESYKPTDEVAQNLMQFQLNKPDGVLGADTFPINPRIRVDSPRPNAAASSEGDFQEESIFDALDLDSVPTLSLEEFISQRVTEVRNVHMCREYIILENGPPSESFFV